MSRTRVHPIDMPHDDLGGFTGFGEEMRRLLAEKVAAAHAAGKWRSSEDILFDPRDPEFMAYWAQKCIDPITEPMRGSGLEDHFRPFRKTAFDLAPERFSATGTWTLSAVGDLMPAPHVETSAGRLYRHLEGLVFGADCAFANLECTVAPGPEHDSGDFAVGGTPIMDISEAGYAALAAHGRHRFDVLQLANNHVLDDGEAGIARTLSLLDRDGIVPLGIHPSAEDAGRPTITRIGDLTVGWVAHTFSVNFKPLPEGKPWIVDMTPFHVVRSPDCSAILAQLAAARKAGCDIVLLCLHWGAEWEFFPLPVQLEWARRFAEAGADAIIGTHPHVIQPVEIYRPKAAPGRQVPIIYSLGNLIPTMGADYTALSLVAVLEISRGRVDGRDLACVTGLELTPVAFMGEDEGADTHAACIPLRDLAAMALEPGTRAYAEGMARYADLVLGPGWRTGAREERPRGAGAGR